MRARVAQAMSIPLSPISTHGAPCRICSRTPSTRWPASTSLISRSAFSAINQSGTQFHEAAQIVHTNYTAPVSLLTWLANYCAQRHSGTLAVLSSVAGERGRKSNYVYGSSKAGLTAFVDGLRNRIDREGVRVMTIKPGR